MEADHRIAQQCVDGLKALFEKTHTLRREYIKRSDLLRKLQVEIDELRG